jgi:dipeptidyl-peptidase 4
VVTVDGRGTPGVAPSCEEAIAGDLAEPVLADQILGLQAAAQAFPNRLDLDRVGIRGWSFGGYLAALAVLRRPEVFHAAFAGAPVTHWQLYDTHYTERYLGVPQQHPHAYDRSSLIPLAAGLRRPLCLAHGLADDNVLAAHTLKLSAALTAHGRPHEVLPLPGVSHMTPQESITENLLRLEALFFGRHLMKPG